MNPRNVVFALGAHDPEMRAIRRMLSNAGYRYAFANRFGRRCNTGNAYNADELTKHIKDEQRLIWVECRSPKFDSERDIIVDHHNPGDPGHAAGPSEFWEGSSIGQVANLIGRSGHELRIVAASDHCLSAAMRGECKGIDPDELMSWRIRARASMGEMQPWLLKRMISRAVERIESLPRIDFGGVQIVDGTFDTTPELRDGAAIAGVPILTTRKGPTGNVKVGLYGAEPDVITAWMKTMRESDFVDHVYGSAHREYAGAILSIETSNRLVGANRPNQKI
ncbi:hypothetical protein NPS53_08800 [Pseudomonas putida]|uniref:hypothetical protein n=1 Tax=Pseudomonas putida TaxID=303 RepID=UPI002364951E|nr:hypothetical protein [Pseudomonas putida]MDD2139672.1 hypothetical protein [Pseudomonas putida]HDS1721596.1 hypothetical protein [Pseudomonas putida]